MGDNKQQINETTSKILGVPPIGISDMWLMKILSDLKEDLQNTKSETRENLRDINNNVNGLREKSDKDFRWIVGLLFAVLAGVVGSILTK